MPSYVLDDRNTLRFGLIGDYTDETFKERHGGIPHRRRRQPGSGHSFHDFQTLAAIGGGIRPVLTDEWKITNSLTLNYGRAIRPLRQFVRQ